MHLWRTYNGSLLESQYLGKWGEIVLKSEPTWTIETLYLRQNQQQHHHQLNIYIWTKKMPWNETLQKQKTMKVQESRRTETGLAMKFFFFLFETGSHVDREGHKLKE